MSFRPTTVTVGDGLRFPGWRPTGERLLANGRGDLTWVLNPPQVRRWRAHGVLEIEREPGWRLEAEEEGAVLRCEDTDAEVDLVQLGGDATRAFEADASEPMTVIPTFKAFHGPDDLGAHLVGGRVLSGGPRTKWPVEQAALYLYRIARLRGGGFWSAVAAHIAGATATRIEASADARPITNHWGEDECHNRFVSDAALLLTAHAESTRAERFRSAAQRAADGVESFGVRTGVGRWYLHDSVEQRAGRNDLVLNTHLHATTALHACGRDVTPARHALDDVLGVRARGGRATAAAAGLAVTDLARGLAPRVAARLSPRASRQVAHVVTDKRALRLPGGFVARDASGRAAPAHYLSVNVSDLAVLQRNTPTVTAGDTLRAALRYTLRLGVRAELREGVGIALLPGALRNAGLIEAAETTARDAMGAGMSPLIGWPGYEDNLWRHLAAGTP